MDDRRRRMLVQLIRGWGFSLAVAILVATSFRSAIADWNLIPSGSMEPTLLVGDHVFVNKLAYDLKVPYTTHHMASWADPERGDIVVFFSPADGQRLIKRVVGLPGDTISMRRNRLEINGAPAFYEPVEGTALDRTCPVDRTGRLCVEEDLAGRRHPVLFTPHWPSRRTFGPLRVPEGQYFVMGDNRDNSADSRFFGFVTRDRIVGRAEAVVLSREGFLRGYRWDRFLKDLS